MIAKDGVGSIKIYASVRAPIAAAILDAADGRVPVTCHLGRTSSKFVLEHGIGGVEHVLEADPLENITNAQHIRQVVKDGNVYDAAKLLALA